MSQKYRFSNSHGRDIKFTGEKMGYAKNKHDEGSRYLALYRTTAGRYVCYEEINTKWLGCQGNPQPISYRPFVCDTVDEIFDFFGMSCLAKELYDAAGLDHAESIS